MLEVLHIDEVDDDDAADVAQPELAGNGLRRLEVGLEERFLEVATADEAARVDVHRGHRLGLIDDQIAARFEGDVSLERLVYLVLHRVQVEQGPFAPVVLDKPAHLGNEIGRKMRSPLIALLRVDAHLLDVVSDQIPDRA